VCRFCDALLVEFYVNLFTINTLQFVLINDILLNAILKPIGFFILLNTYSRLLKALASTNTKNEEVEIKANREVFIVN